MQKKNKKAKGEKAKAKAKAKRGRVAATSAKDPFEEVLDCTNATIEAEAEDVAEDDVGDDGIAASAPNPAQRKIQRPVFWLEDLDRMLKAGTEGVVDSVVKEEKLRIIIGKALLFCFTSSLTLSQQGKPKTFTRWSHVRKILKNELVASTNHVRAADFNVVIEAIEASQ